MKHPPSLCLFFLSQILIVCVSSNYIVKSVDKDQLFNSPQVWRGQIKTKSAPLPQRGLNLKETNSFYQTNPTNLGNNNINGNYNKGMSTWFPIGASGPNPGQVTQNALPSNAICESEQGSCKGSYSESLISQRIGISKCPTGTEWLALGLAFDRQNDKYYAKYHPIHSFVIDSSKTTGFFIQGGNDVVFTDDDVFTVEVYTGNHFKPAIDSTPIHTQLCKAKGIPNSCEIILSQPTKSHKIWIKAIVPAKLNQVKTTVSICDMKVTTKTFNSGTANAQLIRRILPEEGYADSVQETNTYRSSRGISERPADSTASSNDGKGTDLAFDDNSHHCSFWAGSHGQSKTYIGKTFDSPRLINKIRISPRTGDGRWCNDDGTHLYATVYCGESFNTKITNIDRISLGSKDVGRGRGVFSIDLDPWVLCKAVWVEVQNPVGLQDGWEAKGSCAICRFEIYESVGNDFGVIMGKDTEDSSGIYKEEFSSIVSNPTWTTNAKRTSILPTFNRNPNNLDNPDKKSRLLEKVQAFHQDVALKQRLDEPLYFGGRLGSGSLDKRILASHYFGGRLDGDTTKTFVNMTNAFDKDLSTGVTIAGTTNVGDNNGMLIGRHFETDQPFSKIVLKASIDTQSLIEHPTGIDKIDMTFVVKVGHSQDSENGVEIGRLELKDVPSKATPPPLFVLTKTSSTYDVGVKECASIHSLWKYVAANINTVQEMTDVAQLLTDKDVDKAYIGAKEQYTGLPRWKWENKDAPGSTWKYLEEPMTVPPGCWNDVDKKATGDGTTTADPKSQIGQYLSDATMYNRITVSKTSPKGWSDASIGIDILPMVCRRHQATVPAGTDSTPVQEITIDLDFTKEANEVWIEIFSPSHPHAGIFVSEMNIFVQRYERVWSDFKFSSVRSKTRQVSCHNQGWKDTVTPADCAALARSASMGDNAWSNGQSLAYGKCTGRIDGIDTGAFGQSTGAGCGPNGGWGNCVAGHVGTWGKKDGVPPGCVYRIEDPGPCVLFNRIETSSTGVYFNGGKGYQYDSVCKKTNREPLPSTYRPWVRTDFDANRWKMTPKYETSTSSSYTSVDLEVNGIGSSGDMSTAVQCGNAHCTSGCDANFNDCLNTIEYKSNVVSCGILHCTSGCGTAFITCIKDIYNEGFIEIFNGECTSGSEIRMYEGNGDNIGVNDAERTHNCGVACRDKKPALSGSWNGFNARGFISTPSTGRCYCEDDASVSCTRLVNEYKRYDILLTGKTASQAVFSSKIAFGTIEMSYTIVRNRKGTCKMKYGQRLFPYSTGIIRQSNQVTKEACATWCEKDVEISKSVATYEKVADTKCEAADGTDFDQWYKTSTFTSTQCKQWCTDAGSGCVAYGMGLRFDLLAACMLYMKNGIDPTSTSPNAGVICAAGCAATAVTQNVVSKTSDPNWECHKKTSTSVIKRSGITNTGCEFKDGICSEVQGPITKHKKLNGWNGWSCWMHGSDDQKLYMGMTTSKGGSKCKASDMLDLLKSSPICRQSGFVLEHTLRGKTRKGIYSQSHSQQQSNTFYGNVNHVLRGDSHYRPREYVRNKCLYVQGCEIRKLEPYLVQSGEDPTLPDHGPYRVKLIRSGIDGSVHITINGKSMNIKNSMFAGYDALQPWFQVDGASSFRIEDIVVTTRATNFLDYSYAKFAVLQINKPINQPEIEVYFSNLPLSYGNNDHLILVARTPPWRIMEAFQIVDKGCERKNCIQCTKNQECGMCERGYYLHGTKCLEECPSGTEPINIDLSSSMLPNAVKNWEGAQYVVGESVYYQQRNFNQAQNKKMASPINCVKDSESTDLGIPISVQGLNGNAFAAFDSDYRTFWTSIKAKKIGEAWDIGESGASCCTTKAAVVFGLWNNFPSNIGPFHQMPLWNKVVIGPDGTNLKKINSVVVSPDGKNVYACQSSTGEGLVYWQRNTVTGALTNQQQIKDMGGLTDVVVSPDNKNVYAVSSGGYSIHWWDRHADTGALTNHQTIKSTADLNGANTVLVSPDNKHVYVSSWASDCIVYWTRDTTTGNLDQKVKYPSIKQDWSTNIRNMVMSPDGTQIFFSKFSTQSDNYKTGNPKNGVGYCSRDKTDGTLLLLGMYGGSKVQGLHGTINVQISPDGENVYAFGHYSSTIVYWDRQKNINGIYVLINQRQIVDAENLGYCKSGGAGSSCSDTDGQPYDTGAMLPKALAVSPDSQTVYLVGFKSKSIVSWGRDSNGDLKYKAVLVDAVNFNDARGITFSPDGNNLYVVSHSDMYNTSTNERIATDTMTYFERKSRCQDCIVKVVEGNGLDVDDDKPGKWLGYHFNVSRTIVAYTITVAVPTTSNGVLTTQDVPGQWVVEGARDDNKDSSWIKYEDRKLDKTGWVVLDDSHKYESLFTHNERGIKVNENNGQVEYNGWSCPGYTTTVYGSGESRRSYDTCAKWRKKTFYLPRTTMGNYHRFRLRFLSSTKIFPEYNIYSLNFWEKLPDINPGLAIKGRACLGLKDQDPRMNRIRGTVIFNAATVNMKTKYDPPPQLFWGTNPLHTLGNALKKFKLPMDGLLRMTIPALKRPTAASHMIAMNDDGTWIGAIQIIDQGCNTISMLDNCATCDALRCFKCANNTYLDDNICVQKCTGGRIPIDDSSYGVGKYCAGMSDNDITFGKVKGTHVVPVAPCKKDVTYVGTCTSTVAECPLKRVMNLDACKLACEQDLECVALTYDSKEQKCWVWNTKTTERATTTIEGDYISCTSTSQLQKISDAATITVLWEDSDLSSSSLLWSEHFKKECDTATATLQTSKPVETKEICTFMCNNDKACDGFTYDSKNKVCTLLHGCSATKAATGAAATDTSTLLMSSRTTMCQWETISKKKCNTGGDDKTLVDRGQIGPLACRLLCAAQSTASCQCYSIKSSDGTCYLSQATAIALESDVTYTSYKKGTCSKGYYDGDVTTDKNGKNWVEHLFPIVPLTSSVEKEYMTKKLPYKIETTRCKDKTNAITSWDKCKAANIALQVQEQRHNIFSCREKSSTGSCSTFYKGCTKCNNDAFNLDKYAPWNYTMAQQYCMTKPLNTAIVTKYDATKSWAQAKLFCEAKGARLPTRDELCPSGKDSEPAGGYCDGKGTDRWAAVSDVTNEYVGCSSDLSGDGKKRGCYTHTEHTGVVPTWATDSTGRWHGYVYCAEGETYQGPPSDLFQNKACPDDVGTYAFPIGTQENSDNWPYGCIEIEGEGLYFNGKTDSTELEVGNGKTIRSLCNIPVIFSQRESESTTATTPKLGVTSHIQLNYPLLDIPMRKRSACPLAYPYPLEYTTDNWYCYKESDGNTAGGDECSYFGNLPTPSGQGSWNENKADCSSITTPVSDNPKHVVVVIDHGTKDSAWKAGVQIIRSPIEDRGCEFGCGRCDAADHCLECHLSMFLSGGKCHKQCMLGDTVVLPINTIGGVCLPCFHPPLPTIACQDIPGWQDTSTYTCNDYRTNGWCVGNKIVNTNYKNYGAETNCCDCGKDATVPSTSNKIPHLSIKRTHASTDVSFIVPSTRTFQLQVHKDDVSTTHEMILHIKSGHDLFNHKDNIPSVTMSGIENSNCIVTSISTTAKTLRISLTPIQSSTPCIFAQGNTVNVTLINTDCKQCLAANPLPNQMIRTTIQWSSISATARTTSISSSSCPTSWYKTKPTKTCKSPNGRTSHRDIKAENIGYKTRIDLSCDRNKDNECDISLKKYVASDGTIVTATHDAETTETQLSNLFDQSLTTSKFFPPDSYFRTASKTTDNTIKLVFQEPKRLSNIKYRPTFSGYTSGQQGTQQMIKYKITIKEAYVNAPNGIQFTDLILDDWRMCRTGKETQRSRYKTAVEKNCPGQWTNQGWNHLFTYGYSVDLPVPNPDWSSLYGKRPMFVKEVWIEMKYVHNKNIGTGMDELEIWEYSSDQGMSNDQCGCGGTSQIVPDPTFSITFNKGVATMFPSQLKGTNGLMQTMDTAVVKTNSDIKKWTNPTGRPWTYSYLPTGAHRIALFSFDHDINTNSWEGETSTKDLVDLSYVGGPLKLVSGDDAMSTPPDLNRYAGPGSFLTSANSVKYMKWEKRSTAYTLGSSSGSGKDRTWIAWYKGSQKENENGQWQCTVSIFGDETNNVAAGLGIENGKICIGNDGTQIGTTNIADDKWHMLAWTYKQSTQVMTAYVDVAGVMTAEATMTTWTRPEDCHLWNIGGGSVVDGHKSPDKLDEVAVYQTEIAKEYLQDLYDVYMANKAHEPRLHAVIGPDGTYSGIDTIKGNALKIMRDDRAQGYDLSSQWTMDFFTKGPYTHLPNIQYPSNYNNIKYHALTRGYSQDEQMSIESSGWVGTRIGNSFEHMSPKGNKIMFEGKGEWKRVTIVAKGGKTYFYLDTVLWGTASKSSISEILFLGTYLQSPAQGHIYHDWGKLADFRVWKYALTTEQISELPNTKNTKIKTDEYISPTRECKRGEYCIAEVGKCMPNIHPVATPTWLGERNCGCGITQFAGFCSQCDHYLCTGTCRWPMCDDIDDIVYNDYNHNNIVDQKNNLILKKDQNKNKLYDHPCRCSSFSSWSLATPTKMSELAVDTTMTNHQYIMTNDTSYWMSPMTDQLWSYTTPKPIYGTWEYNENGWNPTLKKETAVTTSTVSNGKKPQPTVESFACTSSTAKTDINGGVGSSIGFGCVFKDNKDKRYVRPKSISTEYNKVAMISLESIWSTIDSGEFGFVDRAPRSALVYVRSEITNPVCFHKGQCTKTSSFDVLNTCTETCSINRLLERKCKCGSGGSDPTCIPGDQCTSDNKCIQQCKEGQWSSEDKCICGNGPTKADRKTCDQGEACHHETGTCVKDPCLFQDGKGTTSNICVCAGPTESEICMKGQYCIGGPNEKPCQAKCNGIITAALACINKDTEKIYKPRTIRTIDPFGLERERKFRRD